MICHYLTSTLSSFADEPAPVIKEDSEYPDWVFQLSEKVSFDWS